MDFSLNNKVAVVTGAASAKGVGNAVARSLANEGATVVITDLLEDGIQSLADELQANGHRAMSMGADQSNIDDVKNVVEKVSVEFGGIDVLVNCAALTNNYGTVAKMEVSRWEKEINVNLNGVFYWSQQVLPLMKSKKWGRIVNISSVAGLFGTNGLPAYAVAKAGIHTLTKQVARENAANGITSNCLVLGIIATEIYERNGIDPATVERLVNNIPCKRMGTPEEVANVVTFLCSEQASYVTGSLINVDGALSASL